jgi:electron transfer flavoprotein alpha subunit
MSGEVLVIAEHKREQLTSVTPELLAAGRELANALGSTLAAIVLGSKLEATINGLIGKVDKLYYVSDPSLEIYNPEIFRNVFVRAFREINPDLVLFGYTYLGIELAPALATQLEIPLLSNSLFVKIDNNGKVVVERPLCGGTLRANYQCDLPLMISGPLSGFSSWKTQAVDTTTVQIDYPRNILSGRVKIHELIEDSLAPGITESDIIVAVGRSVGSADKLTIFRDLAVATGGVLVCSRPVVDMGLLPSQHLVGLSGSTVNPRIYMACGISGAAQHMAGISRSSTIIAINKDPLAPIFSVAHYGIVGDMFEIVPLITQEWSTRAATRMPSGLQNRS